MSSPIREFYFGKTILITGATGFIGKALIEKLLRSCSGIERIYILMRDKKERTVAQRWNDYISDDVFKFNGIEISEIARKIVPISGDLSLPGLGISEEDRELLVNNVKVVLHLASYVKFNPPLREAVHHNVLGTISVVQLCRQIKELDVLVYVSTVAHLMHREERKEIVYSTSVSPEHVMEACDKLNEQQLKKYTELFFPNFPNAYTISKYLAEQIIDREKGYYNIAIVRPSATNPAYREPVPGWVLGMHGPSAVAILLTLGIMRTAQFDYKVRPPQVPVDFVCNALIASAWFLSINRSKDLQVYHLTTQSDNAPSIIEILKMLRHDSMSAPSKRMFRPPNVLYFQNKLRVQFEGFFRHWVYAYIMDFMSKLIGTKAGLVKMTDIMVKNVKAVKFFGQRGQDHEINNTIHLINQMSPLDRKEFDFDVKAIDWEPYFKNMWMGMRRYLLKEEDEDIPRAKKRLRTMIFKYRLLMTVWYLFLASMLYFVMSSFCYLINIDLQLSPSSCILDLLSLIIVPFGLFLGYKFIGFLKL